VGVRICEPMKLSKNTVRAIVGLIVIAVGGVMILQYNLSRNTIELRDPTYKRNVFAALNDGFDTPEEIDIRNRVAHSQEDSSLPSIMTMGEKRIRRVYAHFADQVTRRTSFVGSINKDSFLADETGSRRFLVFEVDTINANHGIDMDKVHAQA
jgi:hypothetical protein